MRQKELTIYDYKEIRTPFVFFDETGSVNDVNNKYFGLGMIKCMQPYFLDTKIRKIRGTYRFYDEIKSNKVSKKNVLVIENIINAIFETPGISFSCIVIDKDSLNFEKEFENDPYLAYQIFTEELLKKNIKRNELLIVLADYISTPENVHFEVNIKHNMNEYFNRLAVCGVHRVDSIGVNLIQVTDLLLGAVVYEFKYRDRIVSGDRNKIRIYKYIQDKLDIENFMDVVKKKEFSIILYKK